MNFRSFIASNMSEERTIIISTHQVHDIQHLIDHVAIFDRQSIQLNAPMAEISRKLAFYNTSNPEIVEKALYSQPSIDGYEVVIPSDGEEETDVNLVSLYQLVTTKPELVNEIFKNQAQ